MKQFFLALVLVLTACLLTGNAQEPVKPLPLWLERAQAETSLIADLAFNFTKFDQAVLYAQLGEKWWQTDESRAREWWKKAVEIVAFVPLQEAATGRRMRTSALNTVLRSVGARDKQLSQRLTDTLKALAKQTTDPRSRQELGFQLHASAITIADREPQSAKELVMSALQMRENGGLFLIPTLRTLRYKDPQIADALFTEALALARATRNDGLLRWLVIIPFIMEDRMGGNSPRPPAALRQQVLNAVIERLLITPNTLEEKTRYCQFVATVVAEQAEPLLKLLPERAPVIQQSLVNCQPAFDRDSVEGRRIAKATGEEARDERGELFPEAPKTVDEMLALARKKADPKTRAELIWQAAQKAAEQKDYEQAISILEGMTKEERQFAPHWDTWRALYAAVSAQNHFAQKEYAEARKVLDAAPNRLTAIALIEALRDLAGMGGDRQVRGGTFHPEGGRDFKPSPEEKLMLLDWLNEARRKLQHVEFSSTEEASNKTFTLVLLYAALSHAEALPVFSEAVRIMNQAYAEEVKAKEKGAQEELGWWYQVDLPASFVKEFFDGIRVTVNEMDSRNLQIRMHLGLLDNALGFHREELVEKKRQEATPKAESKKTQPAKP